MGSAQGVPGTQVYRTIVELFLSHHHHLHLHCAWLGGAFLIHYHRYSLVIPTLAFESKPLFWIHGAQRPVEV